MGSLTWVRAAKKAIGLSQGKAYPHLEALLESEEGQVHHYRVLANILSPIFALCFGAITVALAWHTFWILLPGLLAAGGIGYLTWAVLDRLDRNIPGAKAQISQNAEIIWHRYNEFGNVVGLSPAISPAVAELLDEASGIYLRNDALLKAKNEHLPNGFPQALKAIQEAMAKLLQLALPDSLATQELRLAEGWAVPLLEEMRKVDGVLVQQLQNPQIDSRDPLYMLREARIDLQGLEEAREEIREHHRF